MKNFSTKILSLLFIGSVIFITSSCQENDELLLVDQSVRNHIEEFSLSEATQIGNLHNQYLEKFFSDFNYEGRNYLKQFEYSISKSIGSDFGDFELDIASEIEESKNYNESEVLELYYPETKHLLQPVIKLIHSGKNYDLIEFEINKVQNELESYSLEKNDYNAALTALAVLKSSSKFWLPPSRGGNGIGSDILGKLNNNNILRGKELNCVDSVIVADGLTAGTGMIVSAFAAALAGGPVGAAAFFGWVGVRAAIASGTAALLNCGSEK